MKIVQNPRNSLPVMRKQQTDRFIQKITNPVDKKLYNILKTYSRRLKCIIPSFMHNPRNLTNS